MKRLMIVGAAALALAACTDEAGNNDAAPETVETLPASDDQASTSDPDEEDQEVVAEPTQSPTPEPVEPPIAANTIPAQFHGVWDAVASKCDGFSDGRLQNQR